jgi:hypothetical protein
MNLKKVVVSARGKVPVAQKSLVTAGQPKSAGRTDVTGHWSLPANRTVPVAQMSLVTASQPENQVTNEPATHESMQGLQGLYTMY